RCTKAGKSQRDVETAGYALEKERVDSPSDGASKRPKIAPVEHQGSKGMDISTAHNCSDTQKAKHDAGDSSGAERFIEAHPGEEHDQHRGRSVDQPDIHSACVLAGEIRGPAAKCHADRTEEQQRAPFLTDSAGRSLEARGRHRERKNAGQAPAPK